jgi:tetratricopeptide (TPR) repeat protein
MRSWLTVLAAVGVAALVAVPISSRLPGEAPTTRKAPWQRLLQGEAARKAEELEKRAQAALVAGNFQEELTAAEELARLRERAQGEDHWQAVNVRWQVEAIRCILRQDEKGRQAFARVVLLQGRADRLAATGHYKEAQPLLEDVLAIRRKVLGEEHPQTANTHNNLAVSIDQQGRYKEAEQGFRKALAIRRKVLGNEHPDTAQSYNSLAANLCDQGRNGEAQELFQTALALYGKVLGEEDRDTADCCNAMARNLNAQGKYKEAEEGFRKALDICRKVLGEEHPATALFYNNVAYNLWSQGRYREAEEGFRKALAIFRKVVGEENQTTAMGYNNVATTLNDQGRYAEAEEGYRKALAINRKVLGEEHPYTAGCHNNLAACLLAQGKHEEAQQGYQKALDICRKVLGDNHPHTAKSYNNLAACLKAQGRYQEADEGLRKALDLARKIFGEEHPDTAASYSNVALNLYAQGKYREAEEFLARGADAFLAARLHVAASGLGRATKTSERSPLPQLAVLLARNGKPAEAWQRLEQGLGRGLWDDLSARLRHRPADHSRHAELLRNLESLDQRLLAETAVKEPSAEQRRQREDLLGRRLQAQADLARFVQRLEKDYGPVAGLIFDREKIQASLPDDTALLAWVDLPRAGPRSANPDGEHWAVLLRRRGQPVWKRLPGSGPGNSWTEQDTDLARQLREAVQKPRPSWQPLAKQLREQRLTPLSQYLAAQDGLPAVHHLVVLPSPALLGVPVELLAEEVIVSYSHSGTLFAHLQAQPRSKSQGLLALADPIFQGQSPAGTPKPLPPGGVLLTAVQPGSNAARSHLRPGDVLLNYNDKPLATPADLAPLIAAATDARSIPVTVWREDSDRPLHREVGPGKLGVVLADKPAPEALRERRRLDRQLTSRGDDPSWRELPGTRAEVASLTGLFGDSPPPLVLMDSNASQQELYELAQSGELKKYRYLHLATHGDVDDHFPLRSAVILSRDNLPDPGKQLLEGKPVFDGRLTAEEALRQWNLDCELVTLSACQTALGKYEKGEGFVGFAHALLLCGSRSVCLSLWKVDDAATALLMQRFYANLLGKRDGLKAPLGKAAALAEAKHWLRTLRREEALRVAAEVSQGVERGKGRPKGTLLPPLPEATVKAKDDRPYAHPYYWAAFVLIGDPA